MAKLFLKGVRYFKCYAELAFGDRPRSVEGAIDYCVNSPIFMTQVRPEIVELGKILQSAQPRRSMEIGTAYGGTLFLLCNLSSPDAQVISVDLPGGEFGGGYPSRKVPLFRRFPRNGQRLHLIRGDSHALETKARVLRTLSGNLLDYLFIDGDHTYAGVKQDFELYSPLVRSGGMVAFHDIVENPRDTRCEVANFWNEIKQQYPHREIIDSPSQGWAGIGVLFIP
jgi:predicted O-methyltransferase YrrM